MVDQRTIGIKGGIGTPVVNPTEFNQRVVNRYRQQRSLGNIGIHNRVSQGFFARVAVDVGIAIHVRTDQSPTHTARFIQRSRDITFRTISIPTAKSTDPGCLKISCRALADHIDPGRRFALPAQNTGRTFQDFNPFSEYGIDTLADISGISRVGRSRNHAVYLHPGTQLETTHKYWKPFPALLKVAK